MSGCLRARAHLVLAPSTRVLLQPYIGHSSVVRNCMKWFRRHSINCTCQALGQTLPSRRGVRLAHSFLKCLDGLTQPPDGPSTNEIMRQLRERRHSSPHEAGALFWACSSQGGIRCHLSTARPPRELIFIHLPGDAVGQPRAVTATRGNFQIAAESLAFTTAALSLQLSNYLHLRLLTKLERRQKRALAALPSTRRWPGAGRK